MDRCRTVNDGSCPKDLMSTTSFILLSLRSNRRKLFKDLKSSGNELNLFLAKLRYCKSVSRVISSLIFVNRLLDKFNCST